MNILIPPAKSLNEPSKIVDASHLELLRTIIPKMFETMYSNNGIGLAAPQVGVNLRFFIMDIPDGETKNPMVIVNPEIAHSSKELVPMSEGCLSLPGQMIEVSRPDHIILRYMDENLEEKHLEARSLMAKCIQHEMDHLDGILLIDKLSSLKKSMVLRKIKKATRK